ncbi:MULTISPECIES: histidine phosphatase family protein [unclassified Gordonia (in: high G+C Gram-positive bacteria)]|uniref:histidine phosphatase family protein n=1 Tax=unclassified Gordonia (in: high G+C Gram-positive bacteria) TaxID=2657482 RepID=UPI001FFEC858|nr:MULTISPECIES: histidine phosphatase family protein [unclassified Gordonia (in: high G+C Gram-positive bacteria)]UQE75182.1 histidine phosphatase family protein [Gordonia sp. PP30]
MARLHLVRHGETTSNVLQRLDTALPGANLTDFGARQGIRFGLTNPLTAPAVLLSSQARRARQTAELIASAWGIDTAAIDDVHEVQAGDLEDRSDREAHETFRQVVHAWHRGDLDTRLPGGESLEMLHRRYLPVIDRLAAENLRGDAARDVYLVSHGAAIRLIAAHLAGVDAEFALRNHLRNTDSVDLELTDDGWRLLRWGNRTDFVSDDVEPLG